MSSDPKRIFNTKPSNGNEDYPRICLRIWLSTWQAFIWVNTTQNLLVWLDTGMKNKSVNLFSWLMRCIYLLFRSLNYTKNCRQVELFFKWLNEHLKIKKFWGTTENAIRIQIYTAICSYCLVAIVQKDMQLDRSTYELLQILRISLTDKTHLRDLFNKTKFQNDKERFRLNETCLFNFWYATILMGH